MAAAMILTNPKPEEQQMFGSKTVTMFKSEADALHNTRDALYRRCCDRQATIETQAAEVDRLKCERDAACHELDNCISECEKSDETIKSQAATIIAQKAEIDCQKCLNRNAQKVIDDKNKTIDSLDALCKKYEKAKAPSTEIVDMDSGAVVITSVGFNDAATFNAHLAKVLQYARSRWDGVEPVAPLKSEWKEALALATKAEAKAAELRKELDHYRVGIPWPFPQAVCRSWECHADPCYPSAWADYVPGYRVTAEFYLPPSVN